MVFTSEKELTGGNMSTVSTDGDIVYKNAKPQSATVQRLLLHIRQKGVNFCPKPLGFDQAGREMLSFISGVTIDDYPQVGSLTRKTAIVNRAAAMLRALHDATADFDRQETDAWFLRYDGDLPKEVICHNDFAPYNVTFENDLPVGLIDFDTACPAPRVWDLAYAAYRFVPLSEAVYDCEQGIFRRYEPERDREERCTLLRAFLQSYGFTGDIENYVTARLITLVRLFDEECAKGNPAFIKMKSEGHQDFYRREIDFIQHNFHTWR